MPRLALPLRFICLVFSCLTVWTPLAAQTASEAGKDGTRLVQQSPKDAKAKAKKAGEKKAPSAVQLSQAAAPTVAEIHKALDDSIDTLFLDTPLKDCLTFFGDATGINFVLDKQALAEGGVAIDEPMTYKSKPVAVARSLDRILPPLGLTWIVHDDVVQVTTIIAAEEVLVTRTYPVGEFWNMSRSIAPKRRPR